jgi:hypothetical protein
VLSFWSQAREALVKHREFHHASRRRRGSMAARSIKT